MKKLFLTAAFILGFCNIAMGEKVEVFKVNNIKVLYKQNKNLPIFSARVFTAVSASSDCSPGLSSLTSRLMARATVNRNAAQLSKDVDAIGASLETDADYDFSAISISALSGHFAASMEILADVIINPAFNEDEVNLEIRNTLASLSARRDSISRTANDAFIAKYYKGTAFAYPISGNAESVKALTAADLKTRHAQAYNAQTILVCVVGNITKAQVKAAVAKSFAGIAKGERYARPEINFQSFENEKVNINAKFGQAYIFKGYYAPGKKHKDFPTLKVISAILGSRMTARLFVELRERLGLAYEVNAFYPTRLHQSYFGVVMGLDQKNVPLATARMTEILQDLGKNKISKEELRNVQNYIAGVYLLDRQTVGRQSYFLGWREITGMGYKYDEKYLKLIMKVTPNDVYGAAKKYFANPSVTVTVKPDEKR